MSRDSIPPPSGRGSIAPAAGDIRTNLLAPNTILTVMTGHVSAELARARELTFRKALLQTSKPIWVMDLMRLSGFEAMAVTAGSEWFRVFKERDGQKVLLVSGLSAARMVAATLGFSMRLPVRTFERFEHALDELGLANTGASGPYAG